MRKFALLLALAIPCTAQPANPINGGGTGSSFSAYGTIYSANTWTDLSAFTVNGATASVIAAGAASCPAGINSCIQVSGGAGTYTKTLDLKSPITQSPIWTVDVCYVLGTVNGTSYGMGIGLRSNEASGNFLGVESSFNQSTGVGTSTMNITPAGTDLAGTSATISFSAGDKFCQRTTRVYDKMTVITHDITSGGSATLTKTFAVTTGTTAYLPNIGTFSFYAFGGTATITSINISSGLPKGADVACVGDSKTVSYFPTNYAGGWCTLLQSYGYRAYQLAGGNDTTADIVAEIPEIIALAPKIVVLQIGGNDVRNSIAAGTYEANISSIVSQLTAAGITVYVSTYPVENGGVNMTTLNTYITATFPTKYIDINNSWPQTGSGVSASWLDSDTVHPSQVFHTWIAQTVANRLMADGITQQFLYYVTP